MKKMWPVSAVAIIIGSKGPCNIITTSGALLRSQFHGNIFCQNRYTFNCSPDLHVRYQRRYSYFDPLFFPDICTYVGNHQIKDRKGNKVNKTMRMNWHIILDIVQRGWVSSTHFAMTFNWTIFLTSKRAIYIDNKLEAALVDYEDTASTAISLQFL